MNCLCPTHITVKGTRERMLVPCGSCLPCRIRRRSEWTLRLRHEASYWTKKCFVTLTFDDDKYVPGKFLSKDPVGDFKVRLRNCFRGREIKYFGCGEYGGRFHRPHYHLIVFGVSISEMIANKNKLWYDDYGAIIVENVCKETIRYVAGYVCDKLSPSASRKRYGEFPPFQFQSQGLGLRWALSHRKSIVKNKCVKCGKVTYSIPRYYLKKLFPKDTDEEKVENQWFYDELKSLSLRLEAERLSQCGATIDEIVAYRAAVANGTLFQQYNGFIDRPAWKCFVKIINANFHRAEGILERMNLRRNLREKLVIHDFVKRYYSKTDIFKDFLAHVA